MPPPKRRDDNWIDGLRGVASFTVVTGHLCTAFVPYLHYPAMAENGSTDLFQLPFLRLCVAGRSAVAVFFIITGFVNAINPVKNARANNTYVGLTNLARSTFTRSGRLIIPTSIATCIGWFLCQLGAFTMAQRVDAGWIRGGGKSPDESFSQALINLFRALTLFWHNGPGDYDATHWTLVFFLKGSFRIYLAILAMTLITKRCWHLVTAFLYIYCWITGDYLVGINIYAGLILAQMQVDIGPRATTMLPKFVPSIIMAIGLFIICYPQEKPEWAWWSCVMRDFMAKITPFASDVNRYWMSVGTTILMIGIFFSKNARRILTNPLFNFLGRVSFPVYLLHNTVIRTLLVWMAYGRSAANLPVTDDQGNLIQLNRASPMTFVFILPIFYGVLYLIAYAWTLYVDPFCAKVVDKLKNLMFRDEQLAGEKSIPLTNVPA